MADPPTVWLGARQDDGNGAVDSASSLDSSDLPTTSTATIQNTVIATGSATGVAEGAAQPTGAGHRPTGAHSKGAPYGRPSGVESARPFGTGAAGNHHHTPKGHLTGPPVNLPTGVPKVDGKEMSFSMDASMSALWESFKAEHEHQRPTGIPEGKPTGIPTGMPTGIPSGAPPKGGPHPRPMETPSGAAQTPVPSAR